SSGPQPATAGFISVADQLYEFRIGEHLLLEAEDERKKAKKKRKTGANVLGGPYWGYGPYGPNNPCKECAKSCSKNPNSGRCRQCRARCD
ncbi:MAG: hypothetical protein KTR19_13115, partial [Hyphomicrobiales bacterium]|nr:hypothetical protein [Hyphomicrobiales bacterium]